MVKQLYRFLSPRFQNVFLDYQVKFEPRYGHGKPPHAALYNSINSSRNDYAVFLEKCLGYTSNLLTIKDDSAETDPKKPTWNNTYLPGLDIITLYCMFCEKKPEKYVEIGSGNSTKVAYKAKKEHELPTTIISIDPMPRAEIDMLADDIIRKPFEKTDFSFLFGLKENDILFVDNSHRILPNSDAMVFFMEVLPKLQKGVIVQIHDVYLPYDYPQFMCDRAYSEQYGLAAFLLANPKKYKPLLPNYFISEDAELNKILEKFWTEKQLPKIEKHGGSFWLVINE